MMIESSCCFQTYLTVLRNVKAAPFHAMSVNGDQNEKKHHKTSPFLSEKT